MFKHTHLIWLLILWPFQTLFCQVGIGTTNPHPSSILEIKSNTKGFLPPRLTIEQIVSINQPSEGLLAYCSNCCTSGGTLAYFGNTNWNFISYTDCEVLDTDKDGVFDLIDLDDDNDGILDTVEANPVLLTNEFNGTFGTTTVIRDMVNTSVSNYSFNNFGGAGNYAVISQINVWHPNSNLWRYPGHTTGEPTDAYLAINGSINVGTFYSQTVTLQPNEPYKISLWHASANTTQNRPYQIGIRVIHNDGNGNLTEVHAHNGPSTGDHNWQELTTTFTNPNNTVESYSIEIINVSTGNNGNDFSIDDISIRPVNANANIHDFDLDGLNNDIDLDSDNDGIPDNVEFQPTIGYIAPNSTVNALGILTIYNTGLTTQINTDNDGFPDYLDLDSDNDGIIDETESGLTNSGGDTDKDGLQDQVDSTPNTGYEDPNGTSINASNINILQDTGNTGQKDYRKI